MVQLLVLHFFMRKLSNILSIEISRLAIYFLMQISILKLEILGWQNFFQITSLILVLEWREQSKLGFP